MLWPWNFFFSFLSPCGTLRAGHFCIEVVGIFGVVCVVGVVGMSKLCRKSFMSDYIAFGLAYILSEKDNRKGPERNIDVPFKKDNEKDAKRTAKRTSWTGLIGRWPTSCANLVRWTGAMIYLLAMEKGIAIGRSHTIELEIWRLFMAAGESGQDRTHWHREFVLWRGRSARQWCWLRLQFLRVGYSLA